MKTIHVTYHAMLREERGQATETLKTAARTAGDLYDDLCRAHRLRWRKTQLRVAVNDTLRDWNTTLKSGDSVALLPPVAGG